MSLPPLPVNGFTFQEWQKKLANEIQATSEKPIDEFTAGCKAWITIINAMTFKCLGEKQ